MTITRFKKEKRDFKWKISFKQTLCLVWAKLFSFTGNKMKHCYILKMLTSKQSTNLLKCDTLLLYQCIHCVYVKLLLVPFTCCRRISSIKNGELTKY